MKPTKFYLMIFGMILLIGIMASGFVYADRTIEDTEGIYIEDFVAGSTVTADFSYSYLRDRPENPDNSPLILKISINSSDEVNFPVWKGDFEIDGFIRRYILFGLIPIGDIPFICSETVTEVVHPIGSVTITPTNGTFYCFDADGELDFGDFNTRDTVFLNIKSHPALWPGQYTLSAELFYLPDIYPPIVNILNKSYFDQYFTYRSYVDFEVEIIDVNLQDYNAKIIVPEYGNFSFSKEHVSENTYHFYMTLPNEIPEEYWDVLVTAVDTEGNIGYDNTTLKIDRTPPEIEFVGPTDVISDKFTIEFEVTDEKSRVDEESVEVRLREIVNGQICPETGGYLGDGETLCTTTKWIKLEPVGGNIFEVEINATELGLNSNEYWLDARAEDILGNKAEWIA